MNRWNSTMFAQISNNTAWNTNFAMPILTSLCLTVTHSQTAFAAERRRPQRALSYRSISFCLQGAQQQTRRPPLLLSIDGTYRRTDGRMPDRFTLLFIGLLCGMRARTASIRDNTSRLPTMHLTLKQDGRHVVALCTMHETLPGRPTWGHWRSQDFWLGGSCKFSPLTSFTLDDISHSYGCQQSALRIRDV